MEISRIVSCSAEVQLLLFLADFQPACSRKVRVVSKLFSVIQEGFFDNKVSHAVQSYAAGVNYLLAIKCWVHAKAHVEHMLSICY